jgi:hypothetical protein
MAIVHHLIAIILRSGVPNPAEPTGCALTCTTCCPDTGCDTWYSDCPSHTGSCCTQPLVCGQCTGQTCQGTFRIVPEHPVRERNLAPLAITRSRGLAKEIIFSGHELAWKS